MRPGRPAVRPRLCGPPAQALREFVNPGFPRLSERKAGLRTGTSLRGSRTLRREPIREHDVSLARSLAAGARSGGSWRQNRVALGGRKARLLRNLGAISSAFPSADPSPQDEMLFNSVLRQPQLGVLRNGE